MDPAKINTILKDRGLFKYCDAICRVNKKSHIFLGCKHKVVVQKLTQCVTMTLTNFMCWYINFRY